VRLECEKSVIREWARSDKAALVRFANNRNVWRNLTHAFPHPYTDADADGWFSFLAQMPEPTSWAIEIDGLAVGAVGVTLKEGIYLKSAEFGYWLGEPYWGHGIMTEAVKAVSSYAMRRFGLIRLESPVFEWNPASMRVLEKCGFVREGVLRASALKDGQVIDRVLYALVDGTAG
jgi:ribosomal-protein-alanine N-acetyltransferase